VRKIEGRAGPAGGIPLPGLFGTDGVRGVANAELTPEQALRIGRAGAHHLSTASAARRTPAERPFVVLGRDTRLSGDLLTAAVTAGCCSVGVDVVDAGIIPTPGVAFLTKGLGAAGGVVVSASHNPVEDNGIKFFDHSGYKLSAEAEAAIETLVRARHDRLPRPTGAAVGLRTDGRAHLEAYVNHLVALAARPPAGQGAERGGATATPPGTPGLPAAQGGGLMGLPVVVDPAFGAAAVLATEVLRRAGARVTAINDVCDGTRINVDCGSTNPEMLARKVVDEGAAAGLAFDGDADRVILCDEEGRIVDGDQIMAILALDMINRRELPKKTVVATVMSNYGLDLSLREAGGRVVRTPVGDRNVLQKMLDSGLVLGGEQSGHVIHLRHNTTGDGLAAGLAVLAVMSRSGRRLSDLASVVVRLPQVLVNVIVKEKDKLQTSEKVATAIERARESLGHTGRVLVRPSGTEPLVRIMVEGRDAARIEAMAIELASVVAAELGGEIARK
jgi:phosphoglucosamine mutase